MPGKEKKKRPSQKQRKSAALTKYFETSQGKQFLLDAKEQAEIKATPGKLEEMDSGHLVADDNSLCASTVAKRRSPKTPAAFPTHSRQSSKEVESRQDGSESDGFDERSKEAWKRSYMKDRGFDPPTIPQKRQRPPSSDASPGSEQPGSSKWAGKKQQKSKKKQKHSSDEQTVQLKDGAEAQLRPEVVEDVAKKHNGGHYSAADDESDTNEPRYCICNQFSYGEMVACDNKDCPFEWFHYDCVSITQPPKGKWYCSQCTCPNKQKKTQKQKQSSEEQTVQRTDGEEVAQLLPQVFEDVGQPVASKSDAKKKRKNKKKRRPSVDESVQSESGGELQVLSQLSTNSKSSRTSNKSDVETTRRLDQLLEKYSNVAEAVDKDENCHIPNDQLIQERLISYFAQELAEGEDVEGEEEIDQGDDMTREAVKDIVDRMSQESLQNDPGRLILLNSFSNATVSRKMFGGFRKWLKYCRETGRDYKVFDKDAAAAFLLWLKKQTFKRRGATPQHYGGSCVEGYMVSAYTMLRVGGYYRSDQRLKDVLGTMSFIAARYCRRNIGTDKQNRAQITLIPDEIDLFSLQLPFYTPRDVQNLLYMHMLSSLGLRPSSVLRGRPSDNPNQMGLLVKDISFKRDVNLRLRMTLRFRFFKDVVERGHFKDHVVLERDSPFCLVRLTLLHLMLMGCVKFTSANFMREGEIKVRPPRDDINLFCAIDLNDCLLVGMSLRKDDAIWNGLARTVGLPEQGVSARSCRRGFVTATALSLVSDDLDSTVEKLLQLLRSLNMWRGTAALSYIEQDLYWLANVAEKIHPNQPVSFKALPAKLVWQYSYHRCIDKDSYQDPTSEEMRVKVKASKYFEDTLKETIDEKKKKKEEINLPKITYNVLTSLCTRLANESNRQGYNDKAAEITVKPLPEMPLEVLDVELIAKELAGNHVENLSFLFHSGLSRDSEKCPADVVCETVGCNKRFAITGDYEAHRLQHVAANNKFTCKAAQCLGPELTSQKHRKHLHKEHYLIRTCDLCGNRCTTSERCQNAICLRSDNWTSSPVPLYIAQFLGLRKVVVDEGNIRHALDSVDKIRICDDVAGSAIQSYPLLPIVPRRRRFDQLEGSAEGRQYEAYKKAVKNFNVELKLLEVYRKAVTEAEKLMDSIDSD